jgi:hypothetical protein
MRILIVYTCGQLQASRGASGLELAELPNSQSGVCQSVTTSNRQETEWECPSGKRRA